MMKSVDLLYLFLAESKNAYSKLGIKIEDRQRRLTLNDLIYSFYDVLRFLFLKRSQFKLIVASHLHLKAHSINPQFPSLNYFDDLICEDTIVIYRNTAKGTYKRYTNAYDFTLVYAISKVISSPSRHKTKVKIEISVLRCFWYLLNLRPKEVFIADWNNSFAASFIIRGKMIGVPVIELQHGVIHDNHPAYVSKLDLSQINGCDRLFYWYLPEDASFLDNLYPPENRELVDINISKKIISNDDTGKLLGIVLQDSNQKEFCKFIEELITKSNNLPYKFGLRPRRVDEIANYLVKSYPEKNIKLTGDFASVLKEVDVVISHSSTALIDAYLAGTKAICFDFDGLAAKRNSAIIPLLSTGKIKHALTPEDVIDCLKGQK